MNDPTLITRAERLARKTGCKTCGQKIKMETRPDQNVDKLPPRWEMLKNLVVAAKDAIASGLEVRSPEDIEKALKICAECPKLINDDGWLRCGACGCGIGFSTTDGIRPAKLGKLALKSWVCPLGKW